MTPEDLKGLNRKELQALAKQHGIKANAKSETLVAQLSAVFSAGAAMDLSDDVPPTEDEPRAPLESANLLPSPPPPPPPQSQLFPHVVDESLDQLLPPASPTSPAAPAQRMARKSSIRKLWSDSPRLTALPLPPAPLPVMSQLEPSRGDGADSAEATSGTFRNMVMEEVNERLQKKGIVAKLQDSLSHVTTAIPKLFSARLKPKPTSKFDASHKINNGPSIKESQAKEDKHKKALLAHSDRFNRLSQPANRRAENQPPRAPSVPKTAHATPSKMSIQMKRTVSVPKLGASSAVLSAVNAAAAERAAPVAKKMARSATTSRLAPSASGAKFAKSAGAPAIAFGNSVKARFS